MVKILCLRERFHSWNDMPEQPHVNPLINRVLRQVSEYPVDLVNCRNCGAPKRLKNNVCPYCGVPYPAKG